MTHDALSVLHFSTADSLGGSARSAYRIHSGLRQRGHRSRMLVGYRQTSDPDVRELVGAGASYYANRIADKVSAAAGRQYAFLPSSRGLARDPWVLEADVIQLFNTHGGYLETARLPDLGRRAPIVWRLSDMWAFTGHCAYSGACDRWKTGCGACPDLATYPGIGVDRTAALFRQKRRLYERMPLTVVVTSSWMEAQARESPLLRDHRIERIPNGLAEPAFAPSSRAAARRRWDLSADARVILFAAHMLDGNPRKGADVLLAALDRLTTKDDVILALLGEGGSAWAARSPVPVKLLGFHADPASIASAYAAADIVAMPSVLENLPNTLIEALACGRVVVAADSGGMRDGVIDGRTGFLAAGGDADAFAAAMRAALADEHGRPAMELEARSLFDREFFAGRELDRIERLYYDLVTSREKTDARR